MVCSRLICSSCCPPLSIPWLLGHPPGPIWFPPGGSVPPSLPSPSWFLLEVSGSFSITLWVPCRANFGKRPSGMSVVSQGACFLNGSFPGVSIRSTSEAPCWPKHPIPPIDTLFECGILQSIERDQIQPRGQAIWRRASTSRKQTANGLPPARNGSQVANLS